MTDEFKDDPTHGDATNPGLARGRLVLVAVDFSATARHALAWAFDYALHTDATIHTLHVVDRRWSPADLSADPASVQRDVAASEAAAAAELRALTDEARGRLGALHEHVVVGKPADEILRLARELAVDLIVVGSHGVDPVAHLFVGSVAERVVRGATCPVTVVRLPRA
ncbi:MAG: universal stress protein [Myxococcales bacterium]|jgi:nucleotide-binding universal stress UspA family protein|nr:universal stress protein [Myxococcales bacterium]MBK7197709.1 universal stress protein [Myxococcales bacterium]MBL8623010.1 universal stress protein [Myxococcales bacterium]MBP6847640.1 universal stress protein [Kofleriaceae bacterium]